VRGQDAVCSCAGPRPPTAACRGEIFYFDGTLNDLVGRAVTILNTVCMHEVDYGIAWKHTDCHTQEVEARSRRLVISMICTAQGFVANAIVVDGHS
jgi:primary-amine oxidase